MMVVATLRITADLLDHKVRKDAPVAFVGLDTITLMRVDAFAIPTLIPSALVLLCLLDNVFVPLWQC